MIRTIKAEISRMLDDLDEEQLNRFRQRVLLRGEERPLRLRPQDVDNKSNLQMADFLVSIFTERIALRQVLELLREINCNDQAETLESRTRICLDKGDPTFPRTSTGELDTKPSNEAMAYVAVKPSQPVKDPKEVEADAKALVQSEEGDHRVERLVLSRFSIQLGKYKSKHFKWLLENDVGYAAFLVACHLMKSKARQSSLMANKESLTRYANFYPDVRREIAIQCARELKGTEGVGFGKHRSMKLKILYEDPKYASYVEYLRGQASACKPGSKMQLAVGYILKRDKCKASASSASRPTTSGPPQAASRRPIKREWGRGSRAQSRTAKGPKRGDSGWKSTSRLPRY